MERVFWKWNKKSNGWTIETGGRGTFASGNNVANTYKTVDKIGGIKVLQPNSPTSSLKLPEEAHSRSSYILLDKSWTFHQIRIYNEKHEAISDKNVCYNRRTFFS